MDLDKIISELVDKRFNEMLQSIVIGDGEKANWGYSHLNEILSKKCHALVEAEVDKRADEIRAALNQKITDSLERQKVVVGIHLERFL